MYRMHMDTEDAKSDNPPGVKRGLQLRLAICYLFNGHCRTDPYVSIRSSRSVQGRHQDAEFQCPDDHTPRIVAQTQDFSSPCSQEDLFKWAGQLMSQNPKTLPWVTVQSKASWVCEPKTWDRAALHIQVHARTQSSKSEKKGFHQIIETHIGYIMFPLCQLVLLNPISTRIALLAPANQRFLIALDLPESRWGAETFQRLMAKRYKISRAVARDDLEWMGKQAHAHFLESNLYYFTIDARRPFPRKTVRRYQNCFVDVTQSSLWQYETTSKASAGAGRKGQVPLPVLSLVAKTRVRIPGAWFVAMIAPTVGTQMPSVQFFEQCLHRSLLQMGVPSSLKRQLLFHRPLVDLSKGDVSRSVLILYTDLLVRMCTCIWRVYQPDVQDACSLFAHQSQSQDIKDKDKDKAKFQQRFVKRCKRYAAAIQEIDRVGVSCASGRDPDRSGCASESLPGHQHQHQLEFNDEYYGILGTAFPELTADDCESLSRVVYVMFILISMLISCSRYSGMIVVGTTLWNLSWLASQYIPLFTNCAAQVESGSERDSSVQAKEKAKEKEKSPSLSKGDDGYESDHEFDRKILSGPSADVRHSFPNTTVEERLRPNHVFIMAFPRKQFTLCVKRGRDADAHVDFSKVKRNSHGEDQREAETKLESKTKKKGELDLPILVLESTECSPAVQSLHWWQKLDPAFLAWDRNRYQFFELWDRICPFASLFRYCRPIHMVHNWDLYHTIASMYSHEPWFKADDPVSKLHSGELVPLDLRTGYRGVRGLDFFSGPWSNLGLVPPGFKTPTAEQREAFAMFLDQQVAPVVPIEAITKPPPSWQKWLPDEVDTGFVVWLRAIDWTHIHQRFHQWCRERNWTYQQQSNWCEDGVETVFLTLHPEFI